jgi:hypothetical protein
MNRSKFNEDLRFAHIYGGSSKTVQSLVYTAAEKPNSSRMRSWTGLRAVKYRYTPFFPSTTVNVTS